MSKARDGVEDLKTIDANLAAKSPLASPSFTGNVGIGAGTALSPLDVKSGFITVSKDANTAGRIGASEYITGSTANDLIVQATGSGVTKLYQSGVNSLNINAAGIVTKPKQPAFQANAGGNSALPLATYTLVNYNAEIFDQNSDFNTTTQTFTAPVTGKYQFNVQILWVNWDSGASYYYLQLSTSNRTYYELYNGAERSSDVSYCYGHIHVLADMDAGDVANVKIYQNQGTSQTTYDGQSVFTGHLVC